MLLNTHKLDFWTPILEAASLIWVSVCIIALVGIPQSGAFMILFLMHFCARGTPTVVKRSLSLPIYSLMEDWKELEEQRRTLLRLPGNHLLLAMDWKWTIWILVACFLPRLLLWGMKFCKLLLLDICIWWFLYHADMLFSKCLFLVICNFCWIYAILSFICSSRLCSIF